MSAHLHPLSGTAVPRLLIVGDIDRFAADDFERLAHVDRADDAELAGPGEAILDAFPKQGNIADDE